MKITLTKSRLLALKPCDLSERLSLFGSRESLTVKQAFKAGFTVSDILWVAGKLRKLEEIVSFAKECAARSAVYADSANSARAAYYAAYYAARSAADNAASAAYYASYARAAAYYAAHYAAAANNAAASAASAAYYAARSAAAASYYAEVKAQKQHLIELFG